MLGGNTPTTKKSMARYPGRHNRLESHLKSSERVSLAHSKPAGCLTMPLRRSPTRSSRQTCAVFTLTACFASDYVGKLAEGVNPKGVPHIVKEFGTVW